MSINPNSSTNNFLYSFIPVAAKEYELTQQYLQRAKVLASQESESRTPRSLEYFLRNVEDYLKELAEELE